MVWPLQVAAGIANLGGTKYLGQEEAGDRQSGYTGRREFSRNRPGDPRFTDTADDVAHARGGRAFGDYGRAFDRGRGTLVKKFVDKDLIGDDDYFERNISVQKDFVISDKLDELYSVFEGRFDPDLAFKAVGGTDLYSYGVHGGMRTEEILRQGDQKTYQQLHQSEMRRRKVFAETFFQ